jgi:hypothetical protein
LPRIWEASACKHSGDQWYSVVLGGTRWSSVVIEDLGGVSMHRVAMG